MPHRPSITLIGCGKMGGAMLRAWLKQDAVSNVTIIKPTPPEASIADYATVQYVTPEGYNTQITSDILMLAVKPQMIKAACASIARHVSPSTVILSIAAGQSLSSLQSVFGDDAAIIRSMPNTPSMVGKGATVAVANTNVSTMQKESVEQILKINGSFQWIDDESQMDAVTALSGSGPAYIFHLIEAMAKSGEYIGLSPEMAMSLARQTVIGAASLAEHDANIEASTLRENVTSPNGTTAAALSVLMDGRFQDIMDEALKAAQNRSRELNS